MWRRVKSFHAKAQFTSRSVLHDIDCNCSSGTIWSRRESPWHQCADRVPAWRLGLGCRTSVCRGRTGGFARLDHTSHDLPQLVCSARANRYLLLDHVSAALAVGDANQLEWAVLSRAAFSSRLDLRCNGSFAANGALADEY